MAHKRPVRDFDPASDPSIDLLHFDAAAAMLDMTPGHLLELCEAGAIRAVDLGYKCQPYSKRIRIPRKELRFWLQQQARARLRDKSLDGNPAHHSARGVVVLMPPGPATPRADRAVRTKHDPDRRSAL
jgi:hypothetical protein